MMQELIGRVKDSFPFPISSTVRGFGAGISFESRSKIARSQADESRLWYSTCLIGEQLCQEDSIRQGQRAKYRSTSFCERDHGARLSCQSF